ncbi:(d)CMP kinase [Peptoniphilus lacrimalis]|uniref:Cytidylate kinase n=2 Tax=Peptoniphilus lacrimalis TaxID=33031 RepID=D1VSI2_9FIRM|nr:(d)CMP kinase [Peptoniphilus lacrimalis]EFA90546.1 cytidylate kinase [Peptoniphilus lacrimalis 315-B]MDK7722099.1 (d)CMP kinase [Peptoniphilus lacrimalis]MDK7731655.1 (d)CMP kinase [Peptoniphilus lacrimalis]SUB57049.1 Cytidylate kinase [Peptoniphilus lacrimalis]
MQIAIDGPAGSGKSTVAKKIAEKLNIIYIDTGAMYRAITLKLKDIDKKFYEEACNNTNIEFINNKIFLDGKDVSSQIRSEEISKLTSDISKIDFVRKKLVSIQKEIADKNSVVMEGRDITTVVLPDADYKFYLNASPEIRAKRRTLQLKEKGLNADYKEIIRDIKKRDNNDIKRENSPLKVADDAIVIDSSNLTAEESIEKILSYIR